MTIERTIADSVYRNSFGAFNCGAFQVINPGQRLGPSWHIDHLSYHLQEMAARRGNKRVVINLPPRALKSHTASICLPAWLLGRDPTERIICASYNEELANKFSRDCRALMESKWYKRIFPRTRLSPKKSTEREFETTERGFRLSTSVAGTLTGRGGNVLIIDDPIKATDANSENALKGASDWFSNTALSRLDHPSNGLIIVVMQRFHVEDLSGELIESGWSKLVIPAQATERGDYLVAANESYRMEIGELLQPDRNSIETLEATKRGLGSRNFAAQYQQDPMPSEGNLIKAEWLPRYSSSSPSYQNFQRVVISCDPAGKAGERNDYTALVVAGISNNKLYILEVARGHWRVMQMMQHIIARAKQRNADLVIVEDTSSGMGLIQLLREQTSLSVIGRHPKGDKVNRMLQQLGKFESGRVILPSEAAWLTDFERELLGFPGGKYDDQVDALIQLMEWFTQSKPYQEISIGMPISTPMDPDDRNPFSVIDA